MSGQCSEIRRKLEDGMVSDAQLTAHLSACRTCRAHAAVLTQLEHLAPVSADEARVTAIMAALPFAPWQRRRVWTWLPVAAGLLLVGVGLALVGAVPAPSVMGSLPEAAGGLVGWIGSYALDALAAVRSGSDAVQTVAAAGGVGLVIWMLITLLGGGWAVLTLARRGRGVR